ncbi:MAG: RdgB/HAM1 family non-canonical purine NTP pyrophosphatase [Promethearchaeota archaeon]
MKQQNQDLYFVTSNDYKFSEVSKIFQEENLKFHLKQCKLKTTEIQAKSTRDVAIYKLNSVREKINGSFFIEDAGFFVDQPLNGFPGVYSSYVFKTIGNEGILKLITNFEKTKAHFSALIALYFKPKDEILIFEGIVNGMVSNEIRGTQGFGFDPIFIPYEIPDKTFGELTIKEKNKISHRGRALVQLISFLKKV